MIKNLIRRIPNREQGLGNRYPPVSVDTGMTVRSTSSYGPTRGTNSYAPRKQVSGRAAHPGGSKKFSTLPMKEPRRDMVDPMSGSRTAPLMRTEIGDALRSFRQGQGRTLREVSAEARVSLGYLSEVERGQKEASSELLAAITQALGVPLWVVLRVVSDRMAMSEGVVTPDTAASRDLVSVH